jgi:hypothetical protein
MDIPNPQQIQVFQNGVRLVITTDYTVSSGTTVTLVNAASAGDSLVVILFADYQLLDTDALTFTGGTTIEGDLTVVSSGNLLVGQTSLDYNVVGSSLASDGVLRACVDGGLVAAFNRKTSDGDILNLYQDGTTVGSIGVAATDDVYFAGRTGSTKGIYLNDNGVLPATTGGSASDATVDLGNTVLRWKDLYLSSGVFLGGVGSANKLDDYEEGTFTPTSRTTSGTPATFGSSAGNYTKIGNVVYFNIDVTDINTTGTTSSAQLQIDGLPFTVDVVGTRAVVLWDSITFQSTRTSCVATISTSEYIQFNSMGTGLADTPVDYGDLNSGVTDVFISGFYYTNQ